MPVADYGDLHVSWRGPRLIWLTGGSLLPVLERRTCCNLRCVWRIIKQS